MQPAMSTSLRVVAHSLNAMIAMLGVLFGCFAAIGACACIWTPQAADMSVKNHWTFLCILLPFVTLGVLGTNAIIGLPLCLRFPGLASATLYRRDVPFLRWMRHHALTLVKFLEEEIARLDTSGNPADPEKDAGYSGGRSG